MREQILALATLGTVRKWVASRLFMRPLKHNQESSPAVRFEENNTSHRFSDFKHNENSSVANVGGLLRVSPKV